MSKRRQDVHSPTNLVTEDYEYAGATYFGAPNENEFLAQFGGWPWAESDHGGDCFHCGAHLKYYAVLRHTPTHTIVRVGETCLGNRFTLATEDFHRLRQAAKLDRSKERTKVASKVWGEQHPDEYEFLREYYKARQAGGRYNEFFSDLCDGLSKYGSLTDRQLEALQRGMERERTWRASHPQPELSTPAPEGKNVDIEGVILKFDTKIYEQSGDERFVMTVKDDRGFKVWGTVPAPIEDAFNDGRALVGSRVAFKADLKQADGDPYFAWFKFPARARVLS